MCTQSRQEKLIGSMNSFGRGRKRPSDVVSARQQVMPDDHSKVAPLLPIPNRTVKRLSADDSADSRVKVGHRQARSVEAPPCWWGRFLLQNMCCAKESARRLHDLKKLCYNLRLR